MRIRKSLWLAGGGAAWLARKAWQRARQDDLTGQTALVTGGSRGLGLLLARELLREGCRVAICARDQAELDRARDELASEGGEVMPVVCDIADPEDVERMVNEVTQRWEGIDILVNNASIIQVGALGNLTRQDFEHVMAVNYLSQVYTTLAVLPQMRARHAGRIVNITSIGGKISAPHLLAYCGAKFAAQGFSTGLRAELARDGITVTTIAPGLMRTGSHLNALFKGQQAAEFTWFSLGATLPLISMDAERAARQIVQATKRGDAERVLSLPASAVALVNGVFPWLTTDVLSLINRLLPSDTGAPTDSERGQNVRDEVTLPGFDQATILGERAAQRLHQYPGPVEAEATEALESTADHQQEGD